jgi:hypothetical protein
MILSVNLTGSWFFSRCGWFGDSFKIMNKYFYLFEELRNLLVVVVVVGSVVAENEIKCY